MRTYYFLILSLLSTAVTACTTAPEYVARQKFTFDLRGIDANGLIGPPGGQVALAYEFCIPDTPEARAEVSGISPAIQISKSRGRIGCGADQCLCIGETAGPGWWDTLLRLASLPYVERIDRCWFE